MDARYNMEELETDHTDDVAVSVRSLHTWVTYAPKASLLLLLSGFQGCRNLEAYGNFPQFKVLRFPVLEFLLKHGSLYNVPRLWEQFFRP